MKKDFTENTNSPITPAVVYPDAFASKSQILKDNKGKAGVYRLTNKLNGKIYIGSSVNLGRRFTEYFSSKYLQNVLDRSKSPICRALLKYGYSNFSLEILEYCERDNVRAREQHYLDNLEPEYNILKTADSLSGYTHSEETRALIGKANQKAWLARDQASREVTLENLAAANAARSKAVLVTNTETGETVEYASQSAAAKALGVSLQAINSCLKKKNLLKKT